jgi:hypothetical protein
VPLICPDETAIIRTAFNTCWYQDRLGTAGAMKTQNSKGVFGFVSFRFPFRFTAAGDDRHRRAQRRVLLGDLAGKKKQMCLFRAIFIR